MNALRAGALLCLLAGLGLVAYGVVEGSVRFGLALIVPFAYGTGPLPALGFLLVMLAGVLWFFSLVRGAVPLPPGEGDGGEGTRGQTRHGGVVLLGPIPIVWGSDRRILPWMVGAGVALLALALLLTWTTR